MAFQHPSSTMRIDGISGRRIRSTAMEDPSILHGGVIEASSAVIAAFGGPLWLELAVATWCCCCVADSSSLRCLLFVRVLLVRCCSPRVTSFAFGCCFDCVSDVRLGSVVASVAMALEEVEEVGICVVCFHRQRRTYCAIFRTSGSSNRLP